MKKTAGFTLVELIVVIAILGILAGIAIPAYSGYIRKANEASDLQQLDSIKTAAVFAYTEAQVAAGSNDTDVTSIKYVSGTDVYVNGTAETDKYDISTYTDGVEFKSDKFKSGAEWRGGVWSGVGSSSDSSAEDSGNS